MDAAARTIAEYQIRGELGRGAMGVVLDGWDPRHTRRVAIKTLKLEAAPNPPALVEIERFRREAKAAGSLRHPNLVTVFTSGETRDEAYIVMEFVDGPALKTLIEQGEHFTIDDIAAIMEELLAGLQFSHEHRVVHRDIKPGNIMMTADRHVKIVDFGIVQVEHSEMTEHGATLGTWAYMSPEQLNGEQVDLRTDVYSAGVVLYELLTSRRPFEGSRVAVAQQILTADPPPPSQVAVAAPPALDGVVRRAMARQPDDRYASAAEFAIAIRAALAAADATVVVAPERSATSVRTGGTDPKPSARPAGRRGLLAVVAAVCLIAAVGGTVLMSRHQEAPVPTVVPPPPPASPAEPPAGQGTLVPPPPASPAEPPAGQGMLVPPPAGPAEPPTGQGTLVPPPPASPAEPPAGQEAVVPPPPVSPALSVAALTQQIGERLRQEACTLARATVPPDGAVMLDGIASAPQTVQADIQQIAGGTRAVQWRGETVRPTLCAALAVVRAADAGGAQGALAVALEGGRTDLHVGATPEQPGEQILPRITMPDFAGWLRVDLVISDGTLRHLFPTTGEIPDSGPMIAAQPARSFAAHEKVRLGDGGMDAHHLPLPLWAVQEPLGTDLILAVASATKLTLDTKSNEETDAAGYLARLGGEIERVRRAGGQVSGMVLPLHTLPPK